MFKWSQNKNSNPSETGGLNRKIIVLLHVRQKKTEAVQHYLFGEMLMFRIVVMELPLLKELRTTLLKMHLKSVIFF